MRRVLFLMTSRSGSTFLSSLLAGKPLADQGGSPSWLQTDPEHQCRLYHQATFDGCVIDDGIRKRPVVEGPEAYVWAPPAVLQRGFYDGLPGDDWKFVYLMRDQRGRVESRCKKAGGDRAAIFKEECAVSAAEMASVSEIMDDDNFLLLHFEDLVSDPMGTLAEVFRFVGFEMDAAFYKRLAKLPAGKYSDSVYEDGGKGVSERWHSWTEEECNHFKVVAGEGLIRLGHEPDGRWSPPAPKKVEKPVVRSVEKKVPAKKKVKKPAKKKAGKRKAKKKS